jgi:alpha-glucosidase
MSGWWKNAVGYQIYPRSFRDANHDGIGDLQGIIEKLPYLQSLGVDFIWLNPVYASPNVDNGYDISDYQDIHPDFGTMADFEELLAKAHASGIKIIMDLVVNHTSDQHPWFLEAKKGKDNPYRDYYLWADATETKMPNDWKSFFGGSTWTYAGSSQAYFHVFAPEQPDLNWKNPKVREEIYRMIRWWLDLGIDGFRLDAISHIQKEPWDFNITDNPWAPFMNVAGIEVYMKELKEIFDDYPIMTVGEASGVSSKKAAHWTKEDGYLNMIFELEHNVREGQQGAERLNLLGFKKVLSRWQKDLGANGWNALYVENHDNPRIASILGDESPKSAKAIATMYMLLKGTPFIYQGQEIGMTNFAFQSMEQIDAQDSHKLYRILLESGSSPEEALRKVTHWTRDHSRTPLQWEGGMYGGFSSLLPWMAVNDNTAHLNIAEQEKDEQSVLNHYKQLIGLRKSQSFFSEGTFELILKNHPQVFAYLRKTDTKQVLVLANLSRKSCQIDLPTRVSNKKWCLLLANSDQPAIEKRILMQPYDAWVFEEVTAAAEAAG